MSNATFGSWLFTSDDDVYELEWADPAGSAEDQALALMDAGFTTINSEVRFK